MAKKFFDVVVVIPLEPRFFTLIRMFLKTTRSHYSPTELLEIQIFGWIKGGSLRVILRFDARTFEPAMLAWFQSWVQALNAEVIELESYDGPAQEKILRRIKTTSEAIFIGDYSFDRALDEIKARFNRHHGTRRQPRFADNLRISFREFKDFIGEYTGNISYGGMFIRGRTDLPPRSRVEVVLDLPGTAGGVKAIAEVVHVVPLKTVRDFDDKSVSGCGFQFVEFLNDGEILLKDYIRKNFIRNKPAGS